MLRKLLLIVLALIGLSACTANSADLSLMAGKPNLLFFYTEN